MENEKEPVIEKSYVGLNEELLDKPLKKSYGLFIAWMILYCVLVTGVCFIPFKNPGVLIRVTLDASVFGIVVLMFIIYKTEYIYWINGTTYEEAVKAGSERRKAFAKKHLLSFTYCTLLVVGVSVVTQCLNLTYWIDFTVCMVAIMVAAIGTIKYKL